MEYYMIAKAFDGGFVVKHMTSDLQPVYWPIMFAATDIDDALGYIKDKLEPKDDTATTAINEHVLSELDRQRRGKTRPNP